MAGRIWPTSLSASKMRKMSTPVAAASSTNACGHRGRVGGVADGVAAAQQHLQADVRDGRAQLGEPLPGVLGEEAQRHVVGRAAPGLERQQLGHASGRRGRPTLSMSRVRTRVASSDWCASRKVVSVTATAVCARSWRANPAGPELEQALARPGRRRPGAGPPPGSLLTGSMLTGAGAVRLVDGHVGEVGEQLRAAVGRRAGREQLRVLLDEARGEAPGAEVGVVEARPAGTGCWWRRRGSGTRRGRGGRGRRPPRTSGRGR